MEKKAWKYETLAEKDGVIVKVPDKGKHMEFRRKLKLPSGEVIPDRWSNGLQIGHGVICNRNFYGIGKGDLGGKIIATVKVMEKSNGEKSFTMIDIIKAPAGTRVTAELKISPDAQEGILITGTKTRVRIVERQKVI